MLNQPTIAMLNHLLSQNSWAPARLVKFTGRTVRFKVVPFTFACTIGKAGSLKDAVQDATADATFIIPPSLLPRLALSEERAFDLIETSGDAKLIEEVLVIARNLHWDAAEDLSRYTGDIAAERIVGLAKGVRHDIRDAALNLSQAAIEYWTEERPLIAGSMHLDEFRRKVDELQCEAGQLEQRIDKLTHP